MCLTSRLTRHVTTIKKMMYAILATPGSEPPRTIEDTPAYTRATNISRVWPCAFSRAPAPTTQRCKAATQLIGKERLRDDLRNCAREDPGKQTLRPRTLCQPSAFCASSDVRCEDAPPKPEPAVTKTGLRALPGTTQYHTATGNRRHHCKHSSAKVECTKLSGTVQARTLV